VNRRPPKSGTRQALSHTLLIDGNSLFKTGYHGAKNEFNRKGEHIGGLYQFITVLRKLLTENLYHRVFVFWDGKLSGKLRYDVYPEYKSGRNKDYVNGTVPEDASEIVQRYKVQEYLEELFIRQIEDDVVESDDFIAYFCLIRAKSEKVTICTNDRDLAQLINDDVRIYFSDLKTYVTGENYNEFFKHHSENALLVKMISGDNSDSIKGIKGVKETTLLKYFPEIADRPVTLEEIINKAKQLQNKRVEEKKKPLKVLDNLINGITDGSQGEKVYEVNKSIMDLKRPLLTESGLNELEDLISSNLDPEDRGIKNAYTKMKRDGIDILIGEQRFSDYLMPFKKLMDREKSRFITENEN